MHYKRQESESYLLVLEFFDTKPKKKLVVLFSDLWRKETQMTQTLSANKEELGKADTALRSMAGRVSFNFDL